MKKGKTINVGWQDLLIKYPREEDMEGYSTIEEIAREKNISVLQVQRMLYKLRKEGKIDGVWVRLKCGKIGLMYKD